MTQDRSSGGADRGRDGPAHARGREPIPVVYVVSNGRSGSTLLDLLLGSGRGVWTLGEAQVLPWEVREGRYPCGCGRPLRECPFWREALPEIPLEGEEVPIERFRESHGAGKVLRWSLLPDLWRGRVGRERRSEAEDYGRVNAAYFRGVLDAAERTTGERPRWLVDASKDLYRLWWLQASGRFDVRAVHLTKSPAAFVYSTVKPLLPGGLPKTLRSSAWWLVENALILRVCRSAFGPDRVLHLRYEDLARDPERTREAFTRWLGVEFPAWRGRAFREYQNHALAGNRMRWEDTPLRFDDDWRRELPALHRAVARAVTAPLAGRLGYGR